MTRHPVLGGSIMEKNANVKLYHNESGALEKLEAIVASKIHLKTAKCHFPHNLYNKG